jgi:hypothetical protein
MKGNAPLHAFNRGLVSRLALARTDIDRLRLSAEEQTNWMPRTLGSMMLRPGLKYIGATKSNNQAKHIPFVFALDDIALIELTNTVMRVWIDDALVTRSTVTAAVTNGTFDSNLTGWTDADESGGASAWGTGGYMALVGNGTAAAIRRQEVTVNQSGTEHALRVIINRGPVTFKVGSTAGGDDYVTETVLRTGEHSLAFTPSGNFHIEFSSRHKREVNVDSCVVESSGTMEVTAPWATADLQKIRFDQSGDVVFVACDGYQQRRIERRGTGRSWSVCVYAPDDGPFRAVNTGPITLTPSALSGNTTLTASAPLFKSSHAGALFQVNSAGQSVTVSITAQNTFSNPIKVTGVDAQRPFSISISGIAGGSTVRLQRSLNGESGTFSNVIEWVADVAQSYDDGLDNIEAWYRIGIQTGEFGTGTTVCTLNYPSGSIHGVCRVTGFTNSTTVSVEVITDFGSGATDNWREGIWSSYRGFATSVALYEGRLWWAGRDWIVGSISDAFEGFDPDTEGDSGPIVRTLGSGPVDKIHWILPLTRLILGAEGAEKSIRSSSFDEPLTPTLFNIKDASTQGSKSANAVKVDDRGFFVQKGGTRVFELLPNAEKADYKSEDRTQIVPEVCEPSITMIAVQRQPDTRLHCVRSDGTVAVYLYDAAENVSCWVAIETDGDVEDVAVLPGDIEDAVYYSVKRTINSSTVRYLEKWALESECEGSTLNKQADSFVTFTNSPASATVSGLSHLEGASVVVWADGKCLDDADGDIETFTVSSGAITLTDGGSAYEASTGVVGLAYRARYKSTKLAYAAQAGTALSQRKKVERLALILADVHHKGIKAGPDYTTMDTLPQVVNGGVVTTDTVHTAYDYDSWEFPGGWNTDSRLCLEANAPRPCTVLGAVIGVQTNERV